MEINCANLLWNPTTNLIVLVWTNPDGQTDAHTDIHLSVVVATMSWLPQTTQQQTIFTLFTFSFLSPSRSIIGSSSSKSSSSAASFKLKVINQYNFSHNYWRNSNISPFASTILIFFEDPRKTRCVCETWISPKRPFFEQCNLYIWPWPLQMTLTLVPADAYWWDEPSYQIWAL